MRSTTVLLTLAAAGVTPVLAQDIDPVGRYEFETVVQEQPVTGTFEITGSEGAWSVTMSAEGQGDVPIHEVTVDGSVVTMIGSIPDAGELVIELEFDGNEFSGSWSLGMDGGELTGHRVTDGARRRDRSATG